MATILDENILFQAPHLRQSTSYSTLLQSTAPSFVELTMSYDHPDSFTELLDHDDFDEHEGNPTPSDIKLDVTDDSDGNTCVKRPSASQTGTERSVKKS